MDDKARRDEKTNGERQHASRSNDTEERDDSHPRYDPRAERPPLTRRESQDPWPIG